MIIGVGILVVLSAGTIYARSLYVTNSFFYFTLVNALLMCRWNKKEKTKTTLMKKRRNIGASL